MRRSIVEVLSVLAAAGLAAQLSGCDELGLVQSKITLTIIPDTATEGDGTLASQGEVAISRTCREDLVIALASDDEVEITVPPTVTIPAGEASATFDPTVEDDLVVDSTDPVTVTVTASAEGWSSGSDSIDVFDND